MSNVEQKFVEAQIVPDVVPKAPTSLLKVKYPSGAEVLLGNELTPTRVKDLPQLQWETTPGEYYTLCMTDPDIPSRENFRLREWHHWLVGNVQGSDPASGDTLTQFVGSGPPADSGLHRYVYLIYRQPGKLSFDEPRLTNTSANNREHFSIAKFAAKYKLGDPIAGNFYLAEHDEYVPLLYKQLGAVLTKD